jgi:hypothetical protein
MELERNSLRNVWMVQGSKSDKEQKHYARKYKLHNKPNPTRNDTKYDVVLDRSNDARHGKFHDKNSTTNDFLRHQRQPHISL